jgi:multiple sugar transport system substrate-binding protein
VYDATAAAFRQQHPNVQLERVDLGASAQTYDAPLLTMHVAGTPPDVYWLRSPQFPNFINKKLLLNLQPYAKRDAKRAQIEDIYPGILDQYRVRDALYGLPADGGGPVLFWNVGLFEQAGLQSPGAAQDAGRWTADAFVETAQRLTRRVAGKTEAWGTEGVLFSQSIWLAMVWAFGGDYVDKDWSSIVLGEPPGIQGLQWMQDLYTRHGVMPTVAELKELEAREPTDRRELFKRGRLGTLVDWTTAVGFGRFPEAEKQGLRWDATLLPAGKAGQFSVAFFHSFSAAAATKSPDLAWEAAAFFCNADAVLERSIAGVTQPFRRTAATSPRYLSSLPPAFARHTNRVGERSRPMALIVDEQGALAKVVNDEITALREGQRPAATVAQTIKQQGDPLLKQLPRL